MEGYGFLGWNTICDKQVIPQSAVAMDIPKDPPILGIYAYLPIPAQRPV